MLITDIDAPTGGLQKTSRRLLQGLNRHGLTTYVCARNYGDCPRDEVQDGIIIHRSPVVSRALPALNSLFYLVDALIWLVRHRRLYDVIHCQQMFGAAMVGLLAKRLLGKPTFVALHMSGANTGEVSEIRRMPLADMRLRQLRAVDRWVALSTEMKNEVRTLGVAPERVVIIPNGAALPAEAAFEPGVREHARAELKLNYPQLVVFTGRLNQQKGLDTLLYAWKLSQAEHPAAHLLILGEGGAYGNIEPELRALCAELGLDECVHFLGHVPNVGDYLLAADLYVLPTRYEGLSCALVEAMAAGAAIVTTNIPANLDVAVDEVNCLLVSPDDPPGLAAAIARILSNRQLGERLGRAAREKAERDLSVEAMTSQYLHLYTSVSG